MDSCEKGRVMNVSYYYYFEYFTVERYFFYILETELAFSAENQLVEIVWKFVIASFTFLWELLCAHICSTRDLGLRLIQSTRQWTYHPETMMRVGRGEGPDYSVLTIRPRLSSTLSMVIGGLHDWPRHWPLTLTRSSLLTAFARLSTSTFFDADEFLWSLHIARVSKNGGHDETVSFSELPEHIGHSGRHGALHSPTSLAPPRPPHPHPHPRWHTHENGKKHRCVHMLSHFPLFIQETVKVEIVV